jgi:uncharacterized protein
MAGAAIAARLSLAGDDIRGRIRAALCAILALCAFAAMAIAAPQYPNLAGRVTDEAGLLTASE